MDENNQTCKIKEPGEEIVAFVHNLSPVKKAGKIAFTNFDLQTSATDVVKAISFSPDRTTSLKLAMEKKSPIKLRKYEFNEQFNNIVVRQPTVVEECSSPLPFHPSESLRSVVNIQEIKKISVGQLLTVKAKVVNLTQPKVIKTSDKGMLKKCSATLIDPSGSIDCIFWEEWVDCVQENGTYIFTNFRAKQNYYTNEKMVNTAKTGFSVEETTAFTEHLPQAEASIANLTTQQIKIHILGVKSLTSYHVCHACSKKLENSSKHMVCTGCTLKQKPEPQNKHWYARCYVKNLSDEKSNLYLSFFNAHIKRLFELQDKQLSPTDTDDTVEDVLLGITDASITYHVNGTVLEVLK